MSVPGRSRLKNAHLHALILGSSFLISLAIILVRLSMARRDTDASTETPVRATVEAPLPKAAPAPGDGGDAGASAKEVADLLERANELYQSSALEEGRVGELEEAKRLLDEAGVENQLHVGSGGHNYTYWLSNSEAYFKWVSKDWK